MTIKNNEEIQRYLVGLDDYPRLIVENLNHLIQKWQPQLEIRIWHSMGYNIIGYGRATYVKNDNSTGHWFIIGLAAHKSYLSLYIWGTINGQYLLESYGNNLGKVKLGKSCINFKSLTDFNLKILEEAIQKAVDSHKN